tara:strand:- start:16 stop:459 length:444 start_codon:yes stop_codon:yes gene_type:complete
MSEYDVVPIKFNISTTDASAQLGVRVLLNQQIVYENSHIKEPSVFDYSLSDQDQEHTLDIELFGKLPAHTVVNAAGEIVKDALINIENIEFDGIDITQIVSVIAEYHHDFNGTQDPTVSKFHDSLGCNGHVKFKFTTPIYLWLLESM